MSWPQSVEIVVLLSGSLSAEFDVSHVGFIDVPREKQETDSPDSSMKDILPKMLSLYYFILLSDFTSAIFHSKGVWLL